ncbi:MAG: ribosome silencing factor [Erysipelotrichaceae bacterium]
MNELLSLVVKAIDDKKGEDIIVYDFSASNPFIDYAVLTSASNLRQVYAIASNIDDEASKNGIQIRAFEGDKDSRWILVDLGFIVVHVFLDEEREVYSLEKLYAHLPTVDISDVQ